MQATQQVNVSGTQKRRRAIWPWLLVGTPLVLGGAAFVGALVFHSTVTRDLDLRLDDLKQDQAEARAAAAQPRAVLIGEPQPGNAADHYRSLEWAWGKEREPHPTVLPVAWEDREALRGKLCPDVLVEELLDFVQGGESPGEAALAMVHTRRPLLRHMRNALRQERCDWSVGYMHVMDDEVCPDGLVIRQVVAVQAYEAFTASDPERALCRSLELVAFAQDLQRYPTLFSAMQATWVERLGLRALERTLATHALSAEQLARFRAFLALLPEPSLVFHLEGEFQHLIAGQLAILGRDLEPEAGAKVRADFGQGSGFLAEALMWREFRGMDQLEAKRRALCALPAWEREAAEAKLVDAVTESNYLVAGIASSNPTQLLDELDAIRVLRAGVDALAEAHEVRLSNGAFPAQLELPVDPFDPQRGPLSYSLEDGVVTVRSCGEDRGDPLRELSVSTLSAR